MAHSWLIPFYGIFRTTKSPMTTDNDDSTSKVRQRVKEPLVKKITSSAETSESQKKKWPLSQLETAFYFMIWIIHSIGAFLLAARASKKSQEWVDHWTEPSDYIEGMKVDNSDVEWKLFRITILDTILVQTIHSVVFHLAVRYLPKFAQSLFLITFWLLIHLYWTSAVCVMVLAVQALLITAITWYTGIQFFAWILSLLFVINVAEWAPFSQSPSNYYREFNLYLYTAIQVLNFSIYLARKRDVLGRRFNIQLLLDFLEYLLYPPYSFVLIVLYEDFREQIDTLRKKVEECERVIPELNAIFWRILRFMFWFFFMEVVLHFCHVNAFQNSPFLKLNELNNYELSSISYAAGQFFHVKYVLIFGIQRYFASLDGLDPPEAPICISRVSKYSQMWRHFDRGLYLFLKNQVYIPIMSPAKGLNSKMISLRKFGAMIAVFLFVLSWHGVSSPNYLWWVVLSAFEICIERVARDLIVPSQLYQSLKDSWLSEANMVRLTALSMLFTVIPGIFGVFFFLGRTGIGSYMFMEVLIRGFVGIFAFDFHLLGAGQVFMHLMVLGYCFNVVCLYLEDKWPKTFRQTSRNIPKNSL